MTAFKVGDKVRFVMPLTPFRVGDEGTVVELATSSGMVRVAHPINNPLPAGGWLASLHEIELVEPTGYEPAVGDRVRVTIEGEVTATGTRDGHHFDIADGFVYTHAEGVTVEKVEPPVEVFKPGDFVRRESDGAILHLAENGWLNMTNNRFYESPEVTGGYFTSERYEKVELHEAPL